MWIDSVFFQTYNPPFLCILDKGLFRIITIFRPSFFKFTSGLNRFSNVKLNFKISRPYPSKIFSFCDLMQFGYNLEFLVRLQPNKITSRYLSIYFVKNFKWSNMPFNSYLYVVLFWRYLISAIISWVKIHVKGKKPQSLKQKHRLKMTSDQKMLVYQLFWI